MHFFIYILNIFVPFFKNSTLDQKMIPYRNSLSSKIIKIAFKNCFQFSQNFKWKTFTLISSTTDSHTNVSSFSVEQACDRWSRSADVQRWRLSFNITTASNLSKPSQGVHTLHTLIYELCKPFCYSMFLCECVCVFTVVVSTDWIKEWRALAFVCLSQNRTADHLLVRLLLTVNRLM